MEKLSIKSWINELIQNKKDSKSKKDFLVEIGEGELDLLKEDLLSETTDGESVRFHVKNSSSDILQSILWQGVTIHFIRKVHRYRDFISPGAEMVLTERLRQINGEGWTPEHDDEHEDGELANAAACYALSERDRKNQHLRPLDMVDVLWPWDDDWWKPTPNNRVRELEKAGGLIIAEIDRLLRISGKKEVEKNIPSSVKRLKLIQFLNDQHVLNISSKFPKLAHYEGGPSGGKGGLNWEYCLFQSDLSELEEAVAEFK